jgi:hypothetical protein
MHQARTESECTFAAAAQQHAGSDRPIAGAFGFPQRQRCGGCTAWALCVMNGDAAVAGLEFDWFAADSAGRIAMFATAGAGVVPDLVLADYIAHGKILDDVPVEHWGSEKVWDVYAGLGMYVYDWEDVGCHYRRRRAPTAEMPENLRRSVRQLSSLPHFDFEFQNQATIELNSDT